MLLGKRSRHPIERTTSMTGITVDVSNIKDAQEPIISDPLPPGRDIYMYRGDTAFCSLECREQLTKQYERKEKLNVVAEKKEDGHSSSITTS
ncbi:uncharacterized protein LOC111316406 [Durio zibethinus]|uniref:Uncharacterized protein LOC111316406 n=1 Tax=Durio zibethinus TaxID=66656 RepID=A0A6P6BAI9_DURZI|nr:uncharacterized protein LOC111316406 [Durio zibethinus]